MTKLIIFGTGGHGKVAADCAENMGCYSEISFIENKSPEIPMFGPWPVIPSQQISAKVSDTNVEFFVAIGDNLIRERVTVETCNLKGVKLATLIHPSASISRHSVVGSGSLVCANAVIGPMSLVGKGSIVNTGASIDHDCEIGDFTHISVGVRLAGGVFVGKRVFLGIGSVVSNNINLGDNCVVGAGATVINDVSSNLTVIGTPARQM